MVDASQTTKGGFQYLKPGVSSSLYRNGRVLTRRDADGSDGEYQGVDLEGREKTVIDARSLPTESRRTTEEHGFELLGNRPIETQVDFFDHAEVVESYYRECQDIVAEHTGTPHVFAFDHNVRSAAGKASQKAIRGGQQVQAPAHVVHGDYTLTSAPERLQQLAKPPTGNDTLRSVIPSGESLVDPILAQDALAEGGRFAIINLWRNIAQEPVANHPIALCDGQTVRPEDLVVFEIHYQNRVGENYFAKHAAPHTWYYYPEMTRDDALLIKQWDSAGTLARSGGTRGDASQVPCTFSFHSAFDHPETPDDAPDRWSIEVRCIVLYE